MEKQPKFDYSDVKWQENGKLKLCIVVGTRPEIIRLAAVINKCRKYFDVILEVQSSSKREDSYLIQESDRISLSVSTITTIFR